MLQDVGLLIIAASLLILVIVHVPVLIQLRRTATQVEKIIETARMQMVPLSHDLTILSQEVRKILESICRQVESVEEGMDTFRHTALRLRNLEEELLQKVQKPLLEATALISGILQGIELIRRLFRR
jgi:uncharacterized protein YoxC